MMSKFFSVFLKFIVPVAILAAGAGGLAYFISTKPVENPKEVKERSWNISVVEAHPGVTKSQINVYGRLVAARAVDLRSLVGGEVIAVSNRFKNGALLSGGDLILEVDPFNYQVTVSEKQAAVLEARARLAELKASEKADRVLLERDREILELEKRNVFRSEKLRKKGNISAKSRDAAKSALSRQYQKVEQSRAQLDVQIARIGQQNAVLVRQEAGLSKARRDLENTRLIAPFSGYLSNISAELGKQIDARDQVARLTDSEQIDVQFHLSDQQYGLLLQTSEGILGRAVSVIWKAGQQSYDFSGVIERIGAEINMETGGVDVYAKLAATEKLKLVRDGAFVDVTLTAVEYPDTVQVPDYAIFEETLIYVVEAGRLQPRKVEVLYNDGKDVVVRGNLKAGDKILTTRFAEVGPGIKVEIR